MDASPRQKPDNPWTPSQIFGASFVFGPLGGGVAAGVNFARMGKRRFLPWCIVAGAVVFLALAAILTYFVPDGAARVVGAIANLAVAVGFMLVQRQHFEDWKARHWHPSPGQEKFRPNRIGFLFLVGLIALAVEVKVIFLFAIHGSDPIDDAIPTLQASLDEFPAEIEVNGTTYIRVSKQELSKDVLDFLFDGGMGKHEGYLAWVLAPEDEIKRILQEEQLGIGRDVADRRNWPRFAVADLDDPSILRIECDAVRHPRLTTCRRLVHLLIIYQTRNWNSMPPEHERDYVGRPRQVSNQTLTIPCPGIQWGRRDSFEIRLLQFERVFIDTQLETRDLQQTHVAWYFVANWRYATNRQQVRLIHVGLPESEVFWSKIEAVFPNLGQQRIDPSTGMTQKPDPTEVEQNLRDFLGVVAPIYEQSFLPPPPSPSAQD